MAGPRTILAWLASGALTVQAQVTNTTYRVQACGGLLAGDWQTVGLVLANDSGAVQFDDTNAPAAPRRFYRLSL